MECNSSHDFIWFMYIIYEMNETILDMHDLIWRDYLFGINHNGVFFSGKRKRLKHVETPSKQVLQTRNTSYIYICQYLYIYVIYIYIFYMINYISMENPFCF